MKVGSGCFNLGWSIERALTGKVEIDALIKAGFEKAERKSKQPKGEIK